MTGKFKPFLGETDDRNKAFPNVEEMTVTVKQDLYGEFGTMEALRQNRYNKSNIPRYERCRNPRCQQGGLDLQRIVMMAEYGDGTAQHTYHCPGHEGSPQGRRKGPPCDNWFEVSVAIVKKA